MTLQKLNIQPKVDNAAKKKMVQSNSIGTNETLLADEVNAMVNKVNEVVEVVNDFKAIDGFNFKSNVSTYANLPTTGLAKNDAYGVLADGLIYIYNGTSWPAEGNGLDLGLKPTGTVADGVQDAVSGGGVYEAIKYQQPYLSDDILPKIKLINGFYIDHSNGQLVGNSLYSTTDFINYNQDIFYEIIKGQNNIQLAFYDENKQFIATLNNYSITNIYAFANLPCEYFKISFQTSDLNATRILAKSLEKTIATDLKNTYDNLITNYTDGIYVNQNNGGAVSVSGFSATNFIKVFKGRIYRIPPGYSQYAFYDENVKYIPNTQSAEGFRLNVQAPEDGYVRLSFANADLSTRYFRLITNVAPIILDRNIITVRKVGGDFNTINAAFDYANTRDRRQYIEIDNGEWEENLQLLTGLGHDFIGASKNGCRIFNAGEGGDVLKVKAGFNFENITFDQRYGGYAVHPDYGGEGLIEFLNCKFLTTYGSAIGAGSADGQTLRLNRCEIHQIGEYNPTGVLYWHNSVYVDNNSKQQRLEVLFSEIYSANGTPPLRIDDANKIYGDGLGNNASIMFAHNTLYAVGVTPNNNDHNIDLRGHYDIPIVGNIVGCIRVDPQSTGNNLSALNF